jgi:hypothetical protein
MVNENQGKDGWDKFGIVTQFISSVVIAIAGAVFTYLYQSQQSARDRQTADLQRVQTIATFMPFLTSKDSETKQLALTQVQTLLGTKSAVGVALQVNAASQASTPSATAGEAAEPDRAVASALQVIAKHADTESDRKLADDALTQITCGRERWDVKTLSDGDASAVNAAPRETSIAQLVAIPRPSSLSPEVRDSIEKHTFKVIAKLMSVKQEPDRDYRLIIGDASGKTMIAEIPSPDCYKGGDTNVAAKFRVARQKIDDVVGGVPGHDIVPPQPIQVAITGVGFFDAIHGQRGMAPNGLELHPIIALDVMADYNGSAP